MSSVGRLCLYCAKPVVSEDKVSVCDRCYAVHHDDCWDRNGRCSTFRCAGIPRTMAGIDLITVLAVSLEKSNEQPVICPYCASGVYPGILQGRWAKPNRDSLHPNGVGLHFFTKNRLPSERGWLKKITTPKSWFLSGASIRSRSCGKCRRLFIWGALVDDAFVQRAKENEGERFCPHCTTPLIHGNLDLRKKAPGSALFECSETPNFSKDWFGHQILDRFIRNRWRTLVDLLPADSCPSCQYTELSGRPIYRFH